MSNREDRVGEAVAWYFQAAESGAPPDRAAFLARFPDLRPELESFLADKGAFDRAAGPPAPARHDPDATVPPANPHHDTATRPPATGLPADPYATVPPASSNNDTPTLPPATVPPSDPDATTPRANSNPALAPGTALGAVRHFGDYELLSEIARGGMGVVFRARQVSLNREVALKMILTGQLAGPADVIRFRAEAEAAANLDHPNVLPIYEVGEHQGQQYFAMKLVPGGSLAGKVATWVHDPKAAVGVFVKVCRAVEFAHKRGILHRDLKPGNILLDRDGTPFVTDFGLAKKVDADSNLTQSGAIVGTPSYMPPEQARAEKQLTTAADVYALGAILYELLTGRPPFRGPTVLDTILQVLEKDAADPRAVNPKADRDLSVIALKCLEKNPTKRYESAGALADDLDRWTRGEPILAREVTRRERAVKWVKRNPVVAAAALTLVLVLTAGVAVSSWFAYQAGEEANTARAAEAEADRAAKAARTAEAEAKAREKAEAAAKADAKREADAARKAEAEADRAAKAARAAEANAKEREKAEAAAKELAQNATERAEGEKQRAEDQLRRAEWSVYAGKLILAQSAFAENNVAQALAHLDECQWDLRGWEHRHLRSWFGGSKQTLKGHASGVTSVAVSPDGKRIATGSQDFTAKVWDAQTGTEILTLKGHTGPVRGVAFSPDGRRLLTGSDDKTAKVWEAPAVKPEGGADTGTEVLTLKGHASGVTGVAFSPDGKRILTGSWDTTAKVWEVAAVKPQGGADTGTAILTLKGHASGVTGVAFSPDGKRIVTGSQDRTAKVWDADTGAELLALKGHASGVSSVAFSPDNRRILTGSVDGTAKVWDVPAGKPDGVADTGTAILTLKGHASGVSGVAFSPDGTHILTGSYDRTAKVWNANTGTEIVTLKGHTGQVTSVALSPDGTRVITGSDDKTVKVWEVPAGKPQGVGDTGPQILTLKGHASGVSGVAFSPDGTHILTGSGDMTAKVWDAQKGTVVLTLKGHTSPITSVAFSPDGRRILTGSDDSTAKVWEAPAVKPKGGADMGTAILTLKGHAGRVTSVAFGPDGRRILTGGWDGTTKVWNADTGTEVFALKGRSPVLCVAFSPDGRHILSGGYDFTAKVCDADTGTEVLTLRGHTGWVTSVAFSPDGRRILTGSWDGTAKVWEAPAGKPQGVADTGTEILTLKGHAGGVSSAAFSPDGQRVLTGSQDRTAKVWDADKGTHLLTLRAHAYWVASVAFSADGRRIVTGGVDGAAKVWFADRGAETLALKGHTAGLISVAFSPNGRRILTGSGDMTAKVWDINKGTEILTLKGHTGWVTGVAFSPDGQRIVTGSQDFTAKVWNANTGTALLTLDRQTRGVDTRVLSVAFSPNGQRIVTGSADGTATVWEANTGTVILTLKGHTGGVTGVAFSPDGKLILTGSDDKTAKVWEVPAVKPEAGARNGTAILVLKGHTGGVTGVAFSSDGKLIVTGSDDKTAKVWEVPAVKPEGGARNGTAILTLKGPARVNSVAFSPDGRRILTGSGESTGNVDNTATVWEAPAVNPDGFAQKGVALLTLKGHTSAVDCVAFSPDGHHILTGSRDMTANVWDADTGTEILALTGHTQPVSTVAFSPDGKRLFAWTAVGAVLAWSAEDGNRVAADNPPARPARASARSPDGRFVAKPSGTGVTVVDVLRPAPQGDRWPPPDRAERTRHHTEQAARAEKEQRWFAVAFHLGRLLLDAPDDADLKRRRAEALTKHDAIVPTGPGLIPLAK